MYDCVGLGQTLIKSMKRGEAKTYSHTENHDFNFNIMSIKYDLVVFIVI